MGSKPGILDWYTNKDETRSWNCIGMSACCYWPENEYPWLGLYHLWEPKFGDERSYIDELEQGYMITFGAAQVELCKTVYNKINESLKGRGDPRRYSLSNLTSEWTAAGKNSSMGRAFPGGHYYFHLDLEVVKSSGSEYIWRITDFEKNTCVSPGSYPSMLQARMECLHAVLGVLA